MGNSLLDLVMNAKEGSEKAMEELLDRYMPLILKNCKDSSGNPNEDYIQYVRIKLIPLIRNFKIY